MERCGGLWRYGLSSQPPLSPIPISWMRHSLFHITSDLKGIPFAYSHSGITLGAK
jgi:hypothetical protein